MPGALALRGTLPGTMSLGPYLAVAAGGALGALLRYSAGLLLAPPPPAAGAPWPWPRATLCVNVLGCFAAGCALAWLARPGAGAIAERRELLRLFLLVGLCGGFTTFSAFGVETVELLRRGQQGGAALYVALSLALGVAAVALGGTLVGALEGRP